MTLLSNCAVAAGQGQCHAHTITQWCRRQRCITRQVPAALGPISQGQQQHCSNARRVSMACLPMVLLCLHVDACTVSNKRHNTLLPATAAPNVMKSTMQVLRTVKAPQGYCAVATAQHCAAQQAGQCHALETLPESKLSVLNTVAQTSCAQTLQLISQFAAACRHIQPLVHYIKQLVVVYKLVQCKQGRDVFALHKFASCF